MAEKPFAKGTETSVYRIWQNRHTLEIMTNHSDQVITNAAEMGRFLRDTRRSLGLTQPDLMEVCGVDQANLSRIEKGVSGATLETYLRICHALGIDLLARLR